MQAKHLFSAIVAAYLATASLTFADQAAEEATIRANAAKYVESYNRRDSKTMAQCHSRRSDHGIAPLEARRLC